MALWLTDLCNWQIIAAKPHMLYAVAKLSAPGTQSFSHFLSRVKCRDAMDRNKIDTLFFCILLYLLLVWAITSEQMKMKSKLFLRVLGVTHWCDLRHNQISKRKSSSILQCAQFLHIFQKIVYSKIAWVVAIIVSSQIKTYSAYSLWTRSTFSIALLGHFWLFILSWF